MHAWRGERPGRGADHRRVHHRGSGRYLRRERAARRARARRVAGESRDAAIAEVLAASIDLVLAVAAIRAAHEHRTNRRTRLFIAAALLRDLPDLDSWKAFTDRSVQRVALSPLTGLAREQDADTRMIAMDFAGLVVPKTNRFFAAVTAVTLGPDKELAPPPGSSAMLPAVSWRLRGHANAS